MNTMDIKDLDARVQSLLVDSSKEYQNHDTEQFNLYREITDGAGEICLVKEGKFHTFNFEVAMVSEGSDVDAFAATEVNTGCYATQCKQLSSDYEIIHVTVDGNEYSMEIPTEGIWHDAYYSAA